MTAPTVAQSLSRLKLHYDREPILFEKFQEYVRELDDVPETVLDQAVSKLVRTKSDPWFPTVGAIREACAEVTLGLPTEYDAFAEVDAVIKWGRMSSEERSEKPPALNPVVKAALDQVGGTYAFKNSESTVIRGQFGRAFREMRAHKIRNVQMGLQLGPGSHPRENQ